MRLAIRYVTRFRYDGPVTESQNELRASPATDNSQALVHYHVTTQPSSRVASYVDYWGTRVDTFGVRAPHHTLEVVADATVETVELVADGGPVVQGADGLTLASALPTIPFDATREPGFVDQHLEFLRRSAHVDWGPGVSAAGHACRDAAGDDVLALAFAVHETVGALDYRPGATYVGVDVEELFASGGGVCQDFAHLAVAMCRSVGLPARYVSGYLFTVDDATGADAETDEVQVETHAWFEVALPGAGWLALDPTNLQAVGERHVTIGRGRDYDDVAPFRGVYSGAAEHELEVSVVMRRLALDPLEGLPGGRNRPGRARSLGHTPPLDVQQQAQQTQ